MLRRVFQILVVIAATITTLRFYQRWKPVVGPGLPTGPVVNLDTWLTAHPKIRGAIKWELPGSQKMSIISPYETRVGGAKG